MRNTKLLYLLTLLTAAILVSCNSSDTSDKKKSTTQLSNTKVLPILGEMFVEHGDTSYHTIPPFGFTNQHKETITHKNIDGKIHVADFIFTSCPGQCPKMTAAMKRIQQNNKDIDFLLLSFTIDPRRDTAETFQRYIDKAGIDDSNWHFLTGTKARLKEIAENGYMAISGVDQIGEGDGDNHSSAIYLIDKERQIRGLYTGTNPKEVDQLMADLKLLSESYK